MSRSVSPVAAEITICFKIVLLALSLCSLPTAGGFLTFSRGFRQIPTIYRHHFAGCNFHVSRKPLAKCGSIKAVDKEAGIDEIHDDNHDISETVEADVPLDALERTWRYARKPLLSVGAKGATSTHGNSLRQLLEAHTVVKVKVHTRKSNGDLEAAFERLKGLAEASGAPSGLECLQLREKDSIIMFAMPGTRERVQSGDFPPPPPQPYVRNNNVV